MKDLVDLISFCTAQNLTIEQKEALKYLALNSTSASADSMKITNIAYSDLKRFLDWFPLVTETTCASGGYSLTQCLEILAAPWFHGKNTSSKLTLYY